MNGGTIFRRQRHVVIRQVRSALGAGARRPQRDQADRREDDHGDDEEEHFPEALRYVRVGPRRHLETGLVDLVRFRGVVARESWRAQRTIFGSPSHAVSLYALKGDARLSQRVEDSALSLKTLRANRSPGRPSRSSMTVAAKKYFLGEDPIGRSIALEVPTALRSSDRGETHSRRSPSRVWARADRGVIPPKFSSCRIFAEYRRGCSRPTVAQASRAT
jgi:hypothetical protein